MKHTLLLLVFCLTPLIGNAQNATPLFFEGDIINPIAKLKVQLFIDENEKIATISVPTQGLEKLRVKVVHYSADSLIFASPTLQAHYKGKRQGDSISGYWTQSGAVCPLTFHTVAMPPARLRPQHPVKPYPYQEEEVMYHNPDKSIQFGATLTYPKEANACPAVILISGSGQQDRDETLFEHKPFQVIADYLSRKGIAVLRIDDRGVGKTTGSAQKATSEDYAKDVLAGVAYLKTRPEVNAKQIGLIGHSEGGMIAPLAARNNPDIAFIVSLAGVGVDGVALMVSQWKYATKPLIPAIGTERFNQLKAIQVAIIKITAEPIDQIDAQNKIVKARSEWRMKQDSLTSVYGGFTCTEDGLWTQNIGSLDRILTPWMRYFAAYNPEKTLKDVRCPMLILNGEKDRQVHCDLNMNGFKAIAQKQQKKNMEFKQFPHLNHLFQHCQTGNLQEYIQIEETFAPEVLECMSTWIQQHCPLSK